MFKWIGIALVAGVIYMIATGNMGGAKKATANYLEVKRTGGQAKSTDAKAKPNALTQMIEYRNNK
jgi:hypothetical protein